DRENATTTKLSQSPLWRGRGLRRSYRGRAAVGSAFGCSYVRSQANIKGFRPQAAGSLSLSKATKKVTKEKALLFRIKSH
ncbi:hypothetical protein, partial [Lysobacter sp. yr284]|uniref:hypothetical protein n=1 Tax=Lysobacter sp. yr284 TaxID=1761791 RepID=UPI001C31D909